MYSIAIRVLGLFGIEQERLRVRGQPALIMKSFMEVKFAVYRNLTWEEILKDERAVSKLSFPSVQSLLERVKYTHGLFQEHFTLCVSFNQCISWIFT